MGKPSDFLLGLTDFFAVLLPGAIVTWLIAQYLPPSMACTIDVGVFAAACVGQPASDPFSHWVIFSVCAYVIGHFVFMAGSSLDGAYDEWRVRTKPLDSDGAFLAAKDLSARLTPTLKDSTFSALKWSMSYVQIHCPAARLDIERLEASQKLFRSLVVVAAALALHFLLQERAIWSALASVGISLLSFSRFCDQRWKMTELSYATALILDATQAANAAKSVSRGPAHAETLPS